MCAGARPLLMILLYPLVLCLHGCVSSVIVLHFMSPKHCSKSNMYQLAPAESSLISVHVIGPLVVEVDSNCTTTASLVAQILDVNLDQVIISRMP